MPRCNCINKLKQDRVGLGACAPINRRRERNLQATRAAVWVVARDLEASPSGWPPLSLLAAAI
ncbi:hypothetical protein NXC14_PA00325 (plasmid) [Rhizobium sp. NXC14]|nr:hypothetical protein NXC14_PA00325 [Rhizobium sp. NXC14]